MAARAGFRSDFSRPAIAPLIRKCGRPAARPWNLPLPQSLNTWRNEDCAEEFRMLLQLNPPLPMETSKGRGLAYFVIDYGPEADLQWVVFLDADGVCWTVPNTEVRMQFNWTMGRRKPEDMVGAVRDAAAEGPLAPRFRPTVAAAAEK
jgi:hypothetical protein